jgi:hypothetical protein
MKLFFATIFVALLMVGILSAQTVVACQDGLTATIENASIVPVEAELAKKPVYIIIIFGPNNPGPDNGGYKGYFFPTSLLKINGSVSKPEDLRKVHFTAVANIHMLVPNGQCNGWRGIGTFTSIEVTTKKK